MANSKKERFNRFPEENNQEEKEPKPEKRDLKSIEYNLEQGIEEAANRIKELSEKRKKGLLIVCIAGGSASGKTDIVLRRLSGVLGEGVLEMSMDNYYKGNKFIKGQEEKAPEIKPGVEFMDTEKADNWDQPQALDLKLFAHHLKELKMGRKIESPKYDMKGSYRSGETIPVDLSGKKIVLVEGLFALNDKITDFIEPDFKIYVGSAEENDDVHGRLIRRLIRDPGRAGLGEKDIYKYWVETIEPMHRKYIAPTREKADIIINNQYNPKNEAKRIPKLETQLKYVLTDEEAEKIINQLAKLEAEPTGAFNQFDEYLSIPGRSEKEVDELMRFRQEEGNHYVTYKGPVDREMPGLRVRPKIEFELTPEISEEELPKLKGALEKFGYRKIKVINKERKIYNLNDLEIALDKIAGLGNFVEIRIPKKEEPNELADVIQSLGLSGKERISESYFELLREERA